MIVVDVETTGFNPEKNSILSVGALDFDKPLSQFYGECRMWEGALVNPEALKLNGFTLEQIIDNKKRTLNGLLFDFMKWIDGCNDLTLAGENPSFDRDFLNYSFEKCDYDFRIGMRTVDLHSLCYAHHLMRGLTPPSKDRNSQLSGDMTLEYVGLPKEPRPHNAITGTKMEAEAFSRLIYGKPLLQEFGKYPVPDYLR
jgi:DNA polymerase III epsilon subunit-like protein